MSNKNISTKSSKLRCFISSSYQTDISNIITILKENNIKAENLQALSIGTSIQEYVKQKIKQANFAIFIIAPENIANIYYEIGLCEGFGKEYLVILEGDIPTPFFLSNRNLIKPNLKNLNYLRIGIQPFIDRIKKGKNSPNKILINKYSADERLEANFYIKRTELNDKLIKKVVVKAGIEKKKELSYNKQIKLSLKLLLKKVKELRSNGSEIQLNNIVADIFNTLNLQYTQATNDSDIGADFALWSDELGKILGNPIIVEIKRYKTITQSNIDRAINQINNYAKKSEAKVALLLYLSNEKQTKFKIDSTLSPLIIAYDLEDFLQELFDNSFENIILKQRNKIAHGYE